MKGAGIFCSEHFHLNASTLLSVTSLAKQSPGWDTGKTTTVVIGNTTTVVIDLYDTNTITMVARESCSITVHCKTLGRI